MRPVIVSGIITGSLREYSFLLFSKRRVNVHASSLRKHPFLFAAGDVSRETSLAAKRNRCFRRLPNEMFGYQAAIGVCIAVLSLQFS